MVCSQALIAGAAHDPPLFVTLSKSLSVAVDLARAVVQGYLDHRSKQQTNQLASWPPAVTCSAHPVSSSAHHAMAALLLAHRLRASRHRTTTPDNLGKVLPSRRRIAWRLRGLGRIRLLLQSLAWLADDWQAGQSPRVKVQGSRPRPEDRPVRKEQEECPRIRPW